MLVDRASRNGEWRRLKWSDVFLFACLDERRGTGDFAVVSMDCYANAMPVRSDDGIDLHHIDEPDCIYVQSDDELIQATDHPDPWSLEESTIARYVWQRIMETQG